MSREERRQYQRMMKNMDRSPALPPAAKARAERNAARRAARASSQPSGTLTTAFWIRTVLIAVALGFIGFSLQWPNMPYAAYVGLAVAAGAFGVMLGLRLLQRRLANRS
jgi:hypothetical protein